MMGHYASLNVLIGASFRFMFVLFVGLARARHIAAACSPAVHYWSNCGLGESLTSTDSDDNRQGEAPPRI